MSLPKRYNPQTIEPALQRIWEQSGSYHFDPDSDDPVFSIDTPPATVSGRLHLGHTFSYSHPDFIARFWRMKGRNIFYPMGYDDNGLPTDRLVEQQLGVSAETIGRSAFIEKCLQLSTAAEEEYKTLWQRMGLSIDWRYTYRTIDEDSRRISQLSFIQLFQQGLVYRQQAPTIWCPECHTAVAQAELDDLQQHGEFVTLLFKLENGEDIQIATTRPELLPACVAVFVHPEDERFKNLIGQTIQVPVFGQNVPILADLHADPQKGTGVVMCCTFGDQTDVTWWRTYKLPLIEAINEDGRMTETAGSLAGMSTREARQRIKQMLNETQRLVHQSAITHEVRVHERCDTPVEYIITRQWFINVLDSKDKFIEAGEKIRWHPPHMKSRYRSWVANLNWDWCISRQRYYGVPFPVWYCVGCGEIVLAEEDTLPIEPLDTIPNNPCPECGGNTFEPDPDVMDTWATSSMTPEIAGAWLKNPALYAKVAPYSLRPQAHDIIRTWAFYTLVKAKFHFDHIPWQDALISGWGIAGEGMGKISKSRGGGPIAPIEMITQYSADAVRYWAASTGPGKDSIISEEKIQIGGKLVNKIWNVARFSSRFLEDFNRESTIFDHLLTPADQWLLSGTQRLIERVTKLYQEFDYAAAKAETETFFWRFADNYLEMAKQRLYDESHPYREGARYSLDYTLLTLLKLFAPILPHVTEYIYQDIFAANHNQEEENDFGSIHRSHWPEVNPELINESAETLGEIMIDIASTVRRYKSENNIPLGTPLKRLQLATDDRYLQSHLGTGKSDLMSVTRASFVEVKDHLDSHLANLQNSTEIKIGIEA